jgi:hypothetical protein
MRRKEEDFDTYSIPIPPTKKQPPERDLVFVNPEDNRVLFWWPAMVI